MGAEALAGVKASAFNNRMGHRKSLWSQTEKNYLSAAGLKQQALLVDTLERAGKPTFQRIQWFGDKKSGWYAVLEDPKMPASSTLLDQAHNAIDRKLFAMKGFHHPGGSQAAFLTGLAHLYNLIPYQRRALNAGQCGVEMEGRRLPTQDWMLYLQILTSGGFR